MIQPTEDRRRSAPVRILQQKPPQAPGPLHTIRFCGRTTGDAELWLAERGIALGYLHTECEVKVLSYFETDALAVAV